MYVSKSDGLILLGTEMQLEDVKDLKILEYHILLSIMLIQIKNVIFYLLTIEMGCMK